MKSLIQASCCVLVLLATPAFGAPTVKVLADVPTEVGSAGSRFQVPIGLADGAEDVASYALELRYDPKILKIIAIAGGTFDGFDQSPVSEPATYTSGRTVFTAVNDGFVRTPEVYNVAVITFEAIGKRGSSGRLRIGLAPRCQITVASTFAKARTRIDRRMRRVTVQ